MMAPYEFREQRGGNPHFSEAERYTLQRRAERLPERELRSGNALAAFIFSVLMALRHPGDVLRPLARNWAILLPLSLPGLATAAIAPSVVLIFGAEMWDVALSMSDRTAAIFTVISILAATIIIPLFAAKGAGIVEQNLAAFRAGQEVSCTSIP